MTHTRYKIKCSEIHVCDWISLLKMHRYPNIVGYPNKQCIVICVLEMQRYQSSLWQRFNVDAALFREEWRIVCVFLCNLQIQLSI